MLGYLAEKRAHKQVDKLEHRMLELRSMKKQSELQLLQDAAAMTALVKTAWMVTQRQKQGLPEWPLKALKVAVSSTYKEVLRNESAFRYKFSEYNARRIAQSEAYMQAIDEMEKEDILCGMTQ